MQRKEFENRIKSLLPKAADDVVESWAEYATELDQDGTEAAADFYDKNYIALLLVKQRRGEEIATQLFNFGKRFTFNYFELQGAAEKLEAGWSEDTSMFPFLVAFLKSVVMQPSMRKCITDFRIR